MKINNNILLYVKPFIEDHIDLIEKRDIETLYKRLLGREYFTYLNYDASGNCIGEVYYLLMALGINPLEYLTKMPKILYGVCLQISL